MEVEESWTPLNPNFLPDLMDVTDRQALIYVAHLMEKLIQRHEAHNGDSERTRRPSYEHALEQAGLVVRNLVASNTFSDKQLSNISEHSESQAESSVAVVETPSPEGIEELYKKFWLKEVPPISVEDYLNRFGRYCRSSAATYLTAGSLIYMISMDLRVFPITRRNAYRLFCAAFLVSAKLVEDRLYSASRYATTAGLKKPELARLELSFLLLINFKVNADRETLKTNLRNWAELNIESV